MPAKKTESIQGGERQVGNLTVYVEKSYTTKVPGTDNDYAKIVIGINLPYNPSEATLDAAFDAVTQASDLVEEKLVSEIEKLGVK